MHEFVMKTLWLKKILEKYNEIWNKIKNLFGKKFDKELVYNDNYIKTKVDSYNANLYSNKTPIVYILFCNITRFYS